MADPAFFIAVAGLSLSGIVSAARLAGWVLRGDPRAIAEAGRWGAAGLLVLSFPLLLGLMVNQKWVEAIGLSAVMLAAFAFYGPRLLSPFLARRISLDTSGPGKAPPDWDLAEQERREADRVERSIAVLEDYLKRRTGASESEARRRGTRIVDASRGAASRAEREAPPMSKADALEILGLNPGAGAPAIHEAHRRLMQIVHPDRGGSPYFAVKVNQARDVLLGLTSLGPETGAQTSARKRRRQNGQTEL